MGSINTFVNMSGSVVLRSFDRNTGQLRREYRQSNLIVDGGKEYAAKRFCGSVGFLDKIAIGTGTTAASASDAGLENQVLADNAPYGPALLMDDPTQLYLNSILDGRVWSGTINEAGLFGSDILFSRLVLDSSYALAGDEVLQITWTISF